MVTLAAGGDVMLGRWVEKRLAKEGYEKPWGTVDQLLAGANIRFANLECVLSDRPYTTLNRFKLRARASLSGGLKGRFDVLSVANNHSLDCGPEGLADTVATLRRWNIQPLGLPGRPVILVRNGLRIGFLGYSAFGGKGLASLDTWTQDVAELRPKVDCLIVSIHWGTEMSPEPRPDQETMSREMLGAGVDLILGHHPHVWQKVSLEAGKAAAYSLGDFVFDAPPGPRQKTGVLKATLEAHRVVTVVRREAELKNYFPVQTGRASTTH